MEINIRKLNTADFWTLLNIIRKGGKDAMIRLQEANKQDDDGARAMIILDVGMEYAEKELTVLFADLAGMTVEEYLQADFDTTLAILEKLIEQEDIANFIKRVANLAGRFSGNLKPMTAEAAKA